MESFTLCKKKTQKKSMWLITPGSDRLLCLVPGSFHMNKPRNKVVVIFICVLFTADNKRWIFFFCSSLGLSSIFPMLQWTHQANAGSSRAGFSSCDVLSFSSSPVTPTSWRSDVDGRGVVLVGTEKFGNRALWDYLRTSKERTYGNK